ncbi:protein hugin [Musca domestica]|uniref:Protein hugin n=1 Tax=Musca domestica TaxID=7370 RepID=A0A9J7I8L2_MUSDO|nr:protein hugin [Musca domestica]
MTGLSCLTFVVVAFCCYALSSSKPTRNEISTKNLEHPSAAAAVAAAQHESGHVETEVKPEIRHKRSQLDMGTAAAGLFGAAGTTGELKDFNEFLEELGDNAILQSSLMPQSQEAIDVENMSPLVYYMLLQKIKQLQNSEWQMPTRRTPRLGRSIDYQLFDGAAPITSRGAAGNSAFSTSRDYDSNNGNGLTNDYGVAMARQYLPHVMKKSVQFKPRLGKRTQVCD